MFSRFRNHFGTAGLVVAIVALVAALGGGALAATSNGGGKATASAKAKRGPKGPKGDTGPAGPAGPAGSAGPQGPAGANGKDGSNGGNGAVGATGPTGKTGAAGADGQDGSPGATGTTGTTGATGEPWTAGGTLPPEATLTGTWSFMGPHEGVITPVPISFPLPVPGTLTATYVENPGVDDVASCPGLDANDIPLSTPGNLCVYQSGFHEHAFFLGSFGDPASTTEFAEAVRPSGTAALMICVGVGAEPCYGYGTWAVTAP